MQGNYTTVKEVEENGGVTQPWKTLKKGPAVWLISTPTIHFMDIR